MNYQLYTYQIPSTVTFFESKVQRGIGFVYGLSTATDGNAFLIKVPAGTYENYTFIPFIKFTQNNVEKNIFEDHYPQRNAYKEICKLYYNTDNKTDPNFWTYYFKTNTNIEGETTVVIKNLLNDGVIFNKSGVSSFIYKDLPTFSSSGSIVCSANIQLTNGDAGEKVFNAFVNNNIGYTTILDCRDYIAKIVTLPVCRLYDKSSPLSADYFFSYTAFSGIANSSDCTDIFNLVYPETSAVAHGCYQLFNIKTTVNNIDLYYNNIEKRFTTNTNESTWYFNEKTANLDISEAQVIATELKIGSNLSALSQYNVCIKDLVMYGIEFPCSSFICDNINDYLKTN